MTDLVTSAFHVRLAQTEDDLRAVQRLRYSVFVKELNGTGPLVDHEARLERDRFDAFADHLLLIDADSGSVVGTYRLLLPEQAGQAGGYYSASEYDLGVLERSGQRLLEVGRSCVLPQFRGTMAVHQLWQALAAYVARHRVEVIFGVASFHGTDVAAWAAPLSLLHHRHLAPQGLRVRARDGAFQSMNLIDADNLDRKAAMLQVPSLIKGYLRLGGYVGEGAFVDHAFNTIDVCLVMETARLPTRQAQIYLDGRG